MFLPQIKVTLDNEWHRAWKFSSVRLAFLSGVAEIILKYLKDLPQEVAQYIDPHVLSWVATGSALLAVIGRMTQVEVVKSEPVQPDKPAQ